MRKFVCEMCASSDLLKQDEFFVCQCCGTKYTVEAARSMMFGDSVNVHGRVSIDYSYELENLYQAARNARETNDEKSAIMHYENISAKDPNSWEANFYLVILKTNSIKNSEIGSSAVWVSNCLPKVFELVNSNIEDIDEKKKIVSEIINQCNETANWLTSASHNFYKSVTKGNGVMALTGIFGAISSAGSTLSQLTDDTNRCVHIANIMYNCGNYIEKYFGVEDDDFNSYAVWCWNQVLRLHEEYTQVHATQTLLSAECLNEVRAKISQTKRESQSVIDAPQSFGSSIIVRRNQQAITNKTTNMNRLQCTLNNGYKFELGLGQSIQIPVVPGVYSIYFDFFGQSLVPAKNKCTPEFVVQGDVYVDLTPDPVWGGFKSNIYQY